MSVVNLPTGAPVLVVFGRDQSGKPHASWFDQASAELATKAAVLMNMHAVPVDSDAIREVAGSLPRGRVFSSGRAFTPFIKAKLYEQLVEAMGSALDPEATDAPAAEAGSEEVFEASEEQPVEDEAQAPIEGDASVPADGVTAGSEHTDPPLPPAPLPAVASSGTPRPRRMEEIGLGSLVLVEDRANEGWYEAEVIGSNGGMLTLRWRDYAEPTVIRRPHELGFLPVVQG